MNRLVDYFLVVGFDPNSDRSIRSRGKILQRFPEVDWNDVPFNEGVALMVQPLGWRLKPYRSQPTFFASVLTGEDGRWHYFASLSFSEPIQLKAPRSVDDDEESLDGSPGFFGPTYADYGAGTVDNAEARNSGSPTVMYAPKCLVLVSRVDYFATFKNCLGILYAVCLESRDVELETVVGNILCCVTVPPPGGPEIRFSIGAGDRQSLQPPLHLNLPVTHCWVAQLFNQLGIRNTIQLLCAVLTEHKILLHSSSLNRLTEACHALVSLMYPFRYAHVYIPVVPVAVIEVLETPTPFIVGIHSSLRSELDELTDVVVVDLDGGSMTMLDSVPLLPEPLLSETRDTLSRILHPDLSTADLAFPTSGASNAMIPSSFTGSTGSRTRLGAPCAEILDKEIRALFMRIFAKLLHGYRSCLTIIRIQPKPVIEFDKAAFLGQRGLITCPFMTNIVERMFFTSFVQERGPPWRPTDMWDDVYSSMNDWLRLESQDSQMIFVHVKDLAEQLYNNEHPNPQPYVQSIPRLTEGAASRIYQPQFPTLNGAKIAEIIKEGSKASPSRKKIPTGIPRPPRIVPMGPVVVSSTDAPPNVTNSARRLEVLRNCVRWVFEGKTADARKLCPAVVRALKSRAARMALCDELAAHVSGGKVELDHQQFEIVTHLMNCALWDAGPADENAVGAALLPLCIVFCRKLSPRVYQFAYTAIQNHKVWEKLQFWECAYYQSVERQIKQLYKPYCPRPKSPESRKYAHEGAVLAEPSALEIAADQMRQKVNFAPEELQKLTHDEESTLYSLASQFMQWLVYMRVPLDSAGVGRASEMRNNSRFTGALDGDFDGHSVANSVAETDSLAESGFEDAEVPEQTIRFVGRFIDKVCNEGGVSSEHIAALHENVRLVVAMHMEELEIVNRESKRLPPIRKPEVMAPRLLAGEQLIFESLRAYLLPDGREEPGTLPGSVFLPAEGAIFLTNYRIVFKGAPCDPAGCEQTVLRSIPIMTVTKEKKLGVQYLSNEESWLQEGVQIRSAIFQLMKLGFDAEVNVDKSEAFRKKLAQVRHPDAMFSLFCFSDINFPHNYQTQAAKDSAKNATLRGFAKKTFLKTAQKAGLTSKKPGKKKHSPTGNGGIYGSPGHRSIRSIGASSTGYGNSAHESIENLDEEDDISVGVEEGETKVPPRGAAGTFASAFPTFSNDQKTLEKLSERRYVKDFKRFVDSMDGFRVTTVNANYKLTNSYPAAVVVPEGMSDDSIKRLARLYRHSRFPCFTWRHEVTGALLLRGAGFQSKNAVIGLFRNHHLHPGPPSASHGGQGTSGESSAVDQEKFLTAVVKATPLGSSRPMGQGSHLSDSSLSINSLTATLGNCDLRGHSTLTPEVGRKTNTSLQKAMTTLRDQTLFRTVSNSRGSRMGFGASPFGPSTQSPATGGPKENYPLAKGGSASSIGAHMMGKGLRFLGVTSKRRGVRSSGGSGGKGSVAGLPHHHRLSTASNSDGESTAMDDVSIGSSGVHSFRRSALYVFGDKSQIKGLRGDVNGKCDFVPIDYPDARHVKASFKNVLSACVPSKRASDANGDNFFRDMEKSEWLNHLQKIMQLSGAVVDLMDLQGSSVMLCVEEGWDLTAQVSSIAQLCLDPYYRTKDGFRVLVEKEWLAFGHKFSYRTGHTAASQTLMASPFFLQFLDVVHQIHHQYPMAFEFNQYYLRFLGYHSMSYRFKTFVFNWEMDRIGMYGVGSSSSGGDGAWSYRPKLVDFVTSHSDDELGFLGFRNTMNGSHAGSPTSSCQSLDSVFDYIDEHSVRSPTFYNFLYSKEPFHTVLRPFSAIPNLEIWDFFVSEDLSRGSCYDFETAEMEDFAAVKKRRTVMAGYGCVEALSLSGCLQVLENLRTAQMKLGRLPQVWQHVWDKLELPTTGTLPKAEVMSSVQYQGRLLHKRTTVEILLRGRMTCDISAAGIAAGGAEASQVAFSHPHRFERCNYTAPTYCDYCTHLLWGIVRTGMKCGDCGYNAHEKCVDSAPKNCPKMAGSLAVDLASADLEPEPPSPALGTSLVNAGSTMFSTSLSGHLTASMPDVSPPPSIPSTAPEIVEELDDSRFSSSGNQSISAVYLQEFKALQPRSMPQDRAAGYHDGYLYKRGAKLKAWPRRWFVLDPMKHQLRYYHSKEDDHPKGFIDLDRVQSAVAVPPPSGLRGIPKGVDDKSFFDLVVTQPEGTRRVYNFCAFDGAAACEWIEKIQACL